MVDVNADAKADGFRRVELLTGPGRRRHWPDETKAQIVAESCEPGAVVSEVARRWQVSPQQVFTWRREMRQVQALTFVPVVAEPNPSPPVSALVPPIELHLAGATLRIPPGTDAALLTLVLRAVRASAT
jgi:transposase